jgi:hypothetical protein
MVETNPETWNPTMDPQKRKCKTWEEWKKQRAAKNKARYQAQQAKGIVPPGLAYARRRLGWTAEDIVAANQNQNSQSPALRELRKAEINLENLLASGTASEAELLAAYNAEVSKRNRGERSFQKQELRLGQQFLQINGAEYRRNRKLVTARQSAYATLDTPV